MDKKHPNQDLPEEEYRKRHPGTADLDFRIMELSCCGKTAVQIAMEIPCSESTVYRALRRVQNFLSAQNYDRFLQALRKAIDQNPPSFGDDNTKSVLEMLYAAYAENKEGETTECTEALLALNEMLLDFPVVISNAIIDKVCPICDCYERSGFIEGFKLGVHMANELST